METINEHYWSYYVRVPSLPNHREEMDEQYNGEKPMVFDLIGIIKPNLQHFLRLIRECRDRNFSKEIPMRMMTNEILSHNLRSNHVRQLCMLRCFFSFSHSLSKEKKKCLYASMHFFNHTVVSMSELFSIILKTFFIGPGASHSSNRISTTSITIILALFDFILYITILYLSIQMNEEFYDSQRSTIKQSLQLNSEAVQILIRTQSDLYDFMNDLAQNETWSKKLSTLQFIHRDNVMTIEKNINDSLQLFQSNSFDCFLSRQISFYTHTVSLLIYMEQIIQWFFQYLTLKNFNKYSTHVVILSIIILTQSLGLIYFFHLTSISSLYLYTWIFLVRSSMTMYHYSFSD